MMPSSPRVGSSVYSRYAGGCDLLRAEIMNGDGATAFGVEKEFEIVSRRRCLRTFVRIFIRVTVRDVLLVLDPACLREN